MADGALVVAAMSTDPDAVEILRKLGARWSPAFSRSGPLVITARDCVLCGPERDCRCRPCPAPYRRYLATEDEPCGMTVMANGECPRGHRAETDTP